jgi:hypothetical protein
VRDREPFGSWPARPFGERSQVALEIGLIVYSMVATLVLCRLVLLAIGIDDRLWIGDFVFQFTDPAVKIFNFLPGSERTLIGKVTLPDATLAALVALVSLASLARARPAQNL